ncbi:MAG: SAM-dependent methyltransferase [Gammaproteobacteria bacterium]|nr:SAM-dependent methyltransferase [Gammaproteobacteria bacterium]
MSNKINQINFQDLREYIDRVGYNESAVLKELRLETKKISDLSIMQVGAMQGSLLNFLCKIGNFRKCIEVGVFTGYSSICIASGIADDGILYALDNSEEYTDIAKKYWEKAKVNHKIKLLLDDGIKSFKKLLNQKKENSFDFVFIDADKSNYKDYYELSLKLIKTGGLIAIDNTIWKGRVFNDDDRSSGTSSIRKLNDFIKEDNRVDHCLLTIYDGMTLCIKK